MTDHDSPPESVTYDPEPQDFPAAIRSFVGAVKAQVQAERERDELRATVKRLEARQPGEPRPKPKPTPRPADDGLGLATFLAVIGPVPAGCFLTVDGWREQADAAQLRSSERSGAMRSAADQGYIEAVRTHVTAPASGIDRWVNVSVPTTHEAGKGRMVLLWRRTALRLRVAA